MPQTPYDWLAATQANPNSTAFQGQPRIVGLSNGNILVAWTDENTVTAPAGGRDVVGVIYDALGAVVVPAFQLNTVAVNGRQDSAALAATNDGGFYIVYEDGSGGAGTSLLGERYDAAGTLVDSATILADPGAPLLAAPSIAVNLADNAFLVTFEHHNGTDDSIRSRAFDGAMNFVVSRTLAADEDPTDTLPAGEPRGPDTAALAGGGYVTVYQEDDDFAGAAESTVEFRLTNPDGTRGAVVEVSADDGFDAGDARVAALSDGGFVVVWHEESLSGVDPAGSVYARVYEAGGTARSGILNILTRAGDALFAPSVAALEDGTFLVALRQGATLRVRHFQNDGTAIGPNLEMDYADVDSRLGLGTTSDGRILAVWQSQAAGNDIDFGILDTRDALIAADPGDGQITGSTSGASTLVGSSAAETITGFGGDDLIRYVEAAVPGTVDAIDGGAAVNTFEVTALAVQSLVDLGAGLFSQGGIYQTNVVQGAALATLANIRHVAVGGLQDVRGTADGNLLTATGDFSNDLWGLEGNDTLDGGAGNDFLRGGPGDDLYLNPGADIITEFDGEGTDTVESDVEANLYSHVERLILTGTLDIDGFGNEQANTIAGNTGRNDLYGFGGNDTLNGGDSNDILNGGEGADSMVGGNGSDNYSVDNRNDRVVETSAAADDYDSISSTVNYTLPENVEHLSLQGSAVNGNGNNGDNILQANELNNKLQGYEGNDLLSGQDGEDELRGAGGDDSLYGGDGNDRYWVDSPGDNVNETNAGLTGGNDTVYAQIDWALGPNLEILRLQATADLAGDGSEFDNRIFGNSGANLLRGLGGNNSIEGGDGADTLVGGDGDDTLIGGSQADVFRFGTANQGADRIEDFSRNADRFDLAGGSFSAMSVAGNGDVILTHAGGTVRMVSPPNLSLAEWNALVLPAASAGGGAPIAFGTSDAGGWHGQAALAARLQNEIIHLAHGEWLFA